jgi:pimeloyl-ACP methyl ester carboxylesterase
MKLRQKLAIGYIRTKLKVTASLSAKQAAEMALTLFCTPQTKSTKEPPPIFNSAIKHQRQLGETNFMAYQWKAAEHAPKVLILHGFESAAKNFAAYVQPLLEKGMEVWAVDAPAHGASAGNTITMPEYAATIALMEKEFGPFHRFMAHSFGGLALMHFLESVSDLQGRRAVLIAPATETVTAIDMFFHFLQLNAKVRQAFDQLIFEKAGVWPSHYSIPRTLQQVSIPLLWIHDEQDDITPIRDIQSLIEAPPPHLRFMITRGLGHRKIYRDPAVQRALVDFLSRPSA